MATSFVLTLDTQNPEISISNISRTAISEVEGYNECSFDFQSASAFIEYKVMKVDNTDALQDNVNNVQIGTVSGSTNVQATGSFPADTPITTTIKVGDLKTAVSDVDGNYIIKVYIRDEAGNWSI